MKRGFVIGKFHPLHAGHVYLIDTAIARSDAVTVVVCDTPGQKIAANVRASWIKELYPAITVMVVKDIGKDDDSKAWADYTKRFLGYAPDLVFTSEAYGNAYAKYLGCTHVMVDRERKKIPVSGTKIRRSPLAYWNYLPSPVRAYMTRRVCIVGAESTGTTTLARGLAQHYKTAWVPEYGRLYSEAKMHSEYAIPWTTDEFVHIANEQNELEDRLARYSTGILFSDTDSFATSVWHERYVGNASREVESISNGRIHDTYLLTNIDIPFTQDGTRDGEHIREWMHNRFKDELTRHHKKFTLMSGSHEERMEKAIAICDDVLNFSY